VDDSPSGGAAHEIHRLATALEQAGHALRVGEAPAALRGHAEAADELARGADAGAIALAVVVVDEAQVSRGSVPFQCRSANGGTVGSTSIAGCASSIARWK
jgi:hypothetical protein